MADKRRWLPPPVGYEWLLDYRKDHTSADPHATRRATVDELYTSLKDREDSKTDPSKLKPEIIAQQKAIAWSVTLGCIPNVIYNLFVYFITSKSYFVFGVLYSLYFMFSQVVSLFKVGHIYKQAAPNLRFRDLFIHRLIYVGLHLATICLITWVTSCYDYLPLHVADFLCQFPPKAYTNTMAV